ncbi:uncharacterized protein OCT59_005926 [Rhizophagus irregularis]|uniref:Serine-enriched protein n=2 Tax=Rhizophagus irregularis TaxID=588596 RepID=A0A015I0V8_RHIIW|nr:hypothetical protein GLOIN_2v1871670 [Rhizophagus irregularis DAOM 181602=DAOM 197198]EXX50567.1 hypothetical protein RirG_269590 [Rhizophagus irregularis DAOM 197198w]POG77024.1 hypothetical protein GLOIN_2v1871670 [Rhizophagus irregularis DAOM 181602=DAOM 197198]UZO14469.1 hypothetical protein OCT59_005926 [Rhizophagus irregularis]|eukprot:XP_025183890.1 hypothetical protein GLOIN_2v1871670 [Rhizophagus irregularis DAOM 181602=DAOM 197198]
MTSIFHSGLSKDFSSILNDADDYNVIIQVDKNNNIKEFRAHSVILRARSRYFKSALSSEWITKKNNMIIFNKPNINSTVFDIILRYIYTGELDLEKYLGKDLLELLIASDELLLEELFEPIQEYLLKNHITWIQENFNLFFHIVFKLSDYDCDKLQKFCLESICENPKPFFTSKDFLSLDKSVLYRLLERDDLQIDESEIWDCLIKWGIEQTPGLGSENYDRNEWNNEDYEALNNTLNPFIPLIRFMEIVPNNFNYKIRPYKDIIPNKIYKEIEEFYNKGTFPKITTLPALPPRTGKIDSKIIKQNLVKIILKWINKEDYWTSRYKFDLIYRGSIDGICTESFKNKCKGQIESLVLIKVKQTNRIFGGYSSIGFNSIGDNLLSIYNGSQRFYYSSNNFIFSFENDEDTQNMRISRVINYDKAIYDHPNVGFDFGYNSLFIDNCQCLRAHNLDFNYENNLTTYEIYNIEEIETFIITKQ